tara:strand:+ start:97 stop:519 length:423 start_codon:yes stop_codon:yes gene_type:complete
MEMKMPKLLSIEEVMKITRKAKPTIYRRTAEGTFPQPVEVPSTALRGPKTKKMWDEQAVIRWVGEMKRTPKDENIGLDNGEDIARQEQNHEEILKNLVNPFSNSPWAKLKDTQKWYVKHKFVILAAIGGLLAGIIGSVWG